MKGNKRLQGFQEESRFLRLSSLTSCQTSQDSLNTTTSSTASTCKLFCSVDGHHSLSQSRLERYRCSTQTKRHIVLNWKSPNGVVKPVLCWSSSSFTKDSQLAHHQSCIQYTRSIYVPLTMHCLPLCGDGNRTSDYMCVLEVTVGTHCQIKPNNLLLLKD